MSRPTSMYVVSMWSILQFQTYLFLVQILECLLLFLCDSVDEESE